MEIALGLTKIRSSHPVCSQETLKNQWEGP